MRENARTPWDMLISPVIFRRIKRLNINDKLAFPKRSDLQTFIQCCQERERERKFKVVIVIFCIFLLWDSRVWTWWGLKVLKESIKIADVPGIRPLFNKSLKITSFLSHWPLLLLQPTPDNSEPSIANSNVALTRTKVKFPWIFFKNLL